MEHGFWDETYDVFLEQGLDKSVVRPEFYGWQKNDLFEHFDCLKPGYIRPDTYMNPPIETVILNETDEYRDIRNGNGTVLRQSKTGASLPMELSHEIKDKKSYMEYRDRLTNVDFKMRWGGVEESIAAYERAGDYALLCTHMDGFFAYPRELLGVVETLYMYYDDPEFMHLLYDDRVDFYMKLYEPILKRVKLDFAFIWEDMCFKNGPLVSPDVFREFMLPAYKKLTQYLRDFGVENIIVDSDGDVTKLIPLWLEGGVTGLLPFEVQSGMDVVKLGEMFPTLQIVGGLNKLKMFASKQEIDEELDRVLPAMAKRGGYIPSLDHWVPPEIGLENFTYYCEKLHSFRI